MPAGSKWVFNPFYICHQGFNNQEQISKYNLKSLRSPQLSPSICSISTCHIKCFIRYSAQHFNQVFEADGRLPRTESTVLVMDKKNFFQRYHFYFPVKKAITAVFTDDVNSQQQSFGTESPSV